MPCQHEQTDEWALFHVGEFDSVQSSCPLTHPLSAASTDETLHMQAALFLVEIYPAYTDTLSLANIVEWLRFGRSGSAQDASKLDGIPTKEDKSDASDQCSLDRTDS